MSTQHSTSYIALSKSDTNTSVDKLQNCLSTEHLWFSQNGLVINPEKSEAVLLSISQQARASVSSLTGENVAGCVVPLTDTVKILGVTTDHHLTFNTHVQNICKSSYYHIQALEHIRSSLTFDMQELLRAHWSIHVLITPTLYCTVHLRQTLRNYSAYRTHLPESSRTRSELIIFVQCSKTSIGC